MYLNKTPKEMNRGQLLLLFLFVFSFAQAQQGERVVKTIQLPFSIDKQVIEGELPFTDVPPFFSYFIKWPEGDLKINIRFLDKNAKWTSWTRIERDEHNLEKYISQLYFGEIGYSDFQLEVVSPKMDVPQLDLHFFNPNESHHFPTQESTSSARDLLVCPCPMPDFQDRNDWCSTTICPEHPSPSITAVSHLIIHHSAGTNTSNDWAAVVRSIWDYHVNGNGWSDVGYNWLIDPNGVIYQGRGDNILGAHFCAQNSKTMGVCMMGDFTDVTPTDEAISSLESLLAWKSCDRGFDPLASSFHSSSGLTLKNISGHRDGCNTACPGDDFYPLLPDVRQGVADLIENNCAALATNDFSLSTESLELSPNPVSDQFTFHFTSELQGELHWKILTLQQQPIVMGEANKGSSLFTTTVNLEELEAGIYFLELEIEGKKGVWKVVKM